MSDDVVRLPSPQFMVIDFWELTKRCLQFDCDRKSQDIASHQTGNRGSDLSICLSITCVR